MSSWIDAIKSRPVTSLAFVGAAAALGAVVGSLVRGRRACDQSSPHSADEAHIQKALAYIEPEFHDDARAVLEDAIALRHLQATGDTTGSSIDNQNLHQWEAMFDRYSQRLRGLIERAGDACTGQTGAVEKLLNLARFHQELEVIRTGDEKAGSVEAMFGLAR